MAQLFNPWLLRVGVDVFMLLFSVYGSKVTVAKHLWLESLNFGTLHIC